MRFYLGAVTKYQVHSPLVFELVESVLEDERWYYAFSDVEAVRRKMLQSPVLLEMEDYGAPEAGEQPHVYRIPLRRLAPRISSSPRQGRWLFRLAQLRQPQRMLELGAGVGVGAMYLRSGAPEATFISLEGSEACAHVARANLGILGLNRRANVLSGPFQKTLPEALEKLGQPDLVFFDGHHQLAPTLDYFEQCLKTAHEKTLFVFDDIYWSAAMTAAWNRIKQHPRVTLTVDCFDLAFVFITPDIKEKQHFRIVPARFKPWKMW